MPQHDTPKRHTRRWASRLSLIAGSVLLMCGASLLIMQSLAPATVERTLGELKVTTEALIVDAISVVAGDPEPPTVTLGPLGGERELGWCDGRFIEMESYRISGVLPVYAGHNNCGADIILSWELGDHVRVAGSDTLYEVTEERHTRKWENIASLRGMAGDLILQTCFYGQDKMRFLSLTPVAPEE